MAVKKITRQKTLKKAKTLGEIQQTDGKDWSKEKVINPRNLNDVLGRREQKYSSLSAVAYEEQVKEMNLIDLQKECVRVGLMPLQNREIMVGRLMDQFQLHLGCERAKTVRATQLPNPKAVKDILSHGANRYI